jgi:hypothetical protein
MEDSMIKFNKEFEDICFKKFESDSKIGLLSSAARDGYPHIALITSISFKSKTVMMWGQFSQGLSKDYLKDNPKTGFLVVSPDQYWWTGKAAHSGRVIKGEDFDYFNNKPLFRYNSYCGFGAVHYGDLVDVSAGEKLPLVRVLLGACLSNWMKGFAKKLPAGAGTDDPGGIPKLPPYGMNLASKLTALKFIAYIDSDGYPRIIPALQGRPVDGGRLVFSSVPYGGLLRKIPPGAKAAVFMANLELESLLLQGRWTGAERRGGVTGMIFEIEKVYNSMPPLGGYIYPPEPVPNVYGC